MQKNSYVYFIQNQRTLTFKVGLSTDPFKRCQTLQTGSPDRLVVYAYLRGDRELEALIHRRLAEYNIGGEWFRRDGVKAYMRTIAYERWVYRRTFRKRSRPKGKRDQRRTLADISA